MKILIINHYIGSARYGMDYRQYYLAREWVKLGHEVTILGAGYSHLRIHQPKVLENLQTEWIEGIRYLWIKTPQYRSSGYRRIFNILAFVLKALYHYKKIARNVSPDAVLVASTYVLDVYPAFLIAKQCRAKLIYELHDLWPLSPMVIGGYSKFNPFIRIVQRAENFACRNSDQFISVLGNARDYLVGHGLKSEKLVYIPNGYAEDELLITPAPLPPEHEELFQKIAGEARFVIGYAGGHSPSNALSSLILAAGLIPAGLRMAFVLVGDGPEKMELMKMAERRNAGNIYFLPPVSKAAIPGFLSRCDILYAGGISSVLHAYGTSFNKVTDYMIAGKPVVFAVDDPNSLVQQAGCGVQIPAEKPPEIAKAIQYLFNLSPAGRRAIGDKGKEFAQKELGFSSIAKKILDTINVP